MKIIKNVVVNLFLLIIVLFFSYYFAGYFYNPIYSLIYGQSDGGFFAIYVQAAKFFSILALFFIFFVSIIFTAFGDSKKYWWIAILLIPVMIFEAYFDLEHIYILVILGLIGWLVGFLIYKLAKKLTR